MGENPQENVNDVNKSEENAPISLENSQNNEDFNKNDINTLENEKVAKNEEKEPKKGDENNEDRG